MKKLWGSAGLIIATLIWGSAFAAQRSAMEYMSPYAFTAMRCIIGVLALALVTMSLDLFELKRVSLWGRAETKTERRRLLTGGILCGLALTPAMLAQQIGICDTSAGKSGFLTALYIIIVPLLGIFFKRRTTWWLWGAVLLALGGSFLLCYVPGQMGLGRGDLMVLVCSFLYSIHIIIIDDFAAKTDCVRLSLIQFLTAFIISGVVSLFIDNAWSLSGIRDSIWFLIYCGVGSCAVAFTLQMVAQKYMHPVAASLLMSLESVFAVISGWLFLHERLSPREMTGCLILFIGIIIAQVPERKPKTQVVE